MMNLKKLFFLVLFATANLLFAQQIPTCFRLTLSDKNNTPYSIDNPSEFLSERAIAKRIRFNIPVTEQDFPVNPQYIEQICQIDPNIRVLATSKWMNTVTIYCPFEMVLDQVVALPFVTEALPVANYQLWDHAKPAAPEVEDVYMVANALRDSVVPLDYGAGYDQIAIHNGQLLHNLGFRGEDMLIVVFDGGWNGMDSSEFFRPLYESGRVWGTRDLVPWRNYVYAGHYHGTIVTSTMAGMQESVLVGTAPNANYFFIRSEEPENEELIEEDFWAQAAEIADSLGADVINSSLGYTTFPDFPECTYTYESTDGVTSIASRAATILGQKGVVVCVSAGNEGNATWHHIGRPCDAFDILTVGAVDVNGNVAGFSSRGPSADGRVKPDIASVGVATACMYPYDLLSVADGTSLSCPVAAGLCACLWQALPEATSTQIMQYVRESSSCYNQPNDSIGYGIPDFFAAYTRHVSVNAPESHTVKVFPNPCQNHLNLLNADLSVSTVELFSADGRRLCLLYPAAENVIKMDVKNLPQGCYLGRVTLHNGETRSFRFVKQ